MRFDEISKGKSPKKKTSPTLPYHAGWDTLQQIKELAAHAGNRLASNPQLFVPRKTKVLTPREKQLRLLKKSWAWDNEGNIKPGYEQNESMNEAAPILFPGKYPSPPGNNKPGGAFWTSSAIKMPGNYYKSDWSNWVHDNMPQWASDTGYLYKVKPGALVLELNSVQDAENIYQTFVELGVVPPITDSYEINLKVKFPWNEVAKHFDAVWHEGYGSYGDMFVYGWDVESTAWFNTDFLQLMGEVKVYDSSDDDNDW